MSSRRAWLGGALALAGCAHGARARGVVRLAMVADLGGLGDHSYNDSAWAGMLDARDRLGARISILQSTTAANYQPSMMVFASDGFDAIYCIGYDEAYDLAEVAARFPASRFALIDAVVDRPNVTSITFRSHEASFLAGALAALVTRTRTIGFLGGIDIPIIQEFEVGYRAGARAVDPSIDVLVKYVGDFADVASGAELSSLMYDANADIIYAAAGKAGLGTMQQVRGRNNVYAIGVDSDQDGLVPGKVLTSVLKRIDVSVFRFAQLTIAHRPQPRSLSLGLRDGAVGLTDFRYTRNVVTPATIARLGRLKNDVVRGAITVPKTRAALESFHA